MFILSQIRANIFFFFSRYRRIEQQFLPARMMEVTPLLGGQVKERKKKGVSSYFHLTPFSIFKRAHKIVVRNGRLVDVTEEEEDKLAITALKKVREVV